MSTKKILVIGGTGAQGFAVVKALLSSPDFSVRVLARNPSSPNVVEAFNDTSNVLLADLLAALYTGSHDLHESSAIIQYPEFIQLLKRLGA